MGSQYTPVWFRRSCCMTGCWASRWLPRGGVLASVGGCGGCGGHEMVPVLVSKGGWERGCGLALAADSSQPAAGSSLNLPDSSQPMPDSSLFGNWGFERWRVSITLSWKVTRPESSRCMRRSRRATGPPIRGAPPWFTPRPRGSPPRAGPSKSDQEYLCAQPPPVIPMMLAWCASLSAWASRPRYAVLRCRARGRGSPVALIPAVVNTRCSSFGQPETSFVPVQSV